MAACPICNRETVKAFRPFCSRRCADVDLAKWMNGAYAVPAEEEDAPDPMDADGGADGSGARPQRPH